jgi:hypothetical protein
VFWAKGGNCPRFAMTSFADRLAAGSMRHRITCCLKTKKEHGKEYEMMSMA